MYRTAGKRFSYNALRAAFTGRLREIKFEARSCSWKFYWSIVQNRNITALVAYAKVSGNTIRRTKFYTVCTFSVQKKEKKLAVLIKFSNQRIQSKSSRYYEGARSSLAFSTIKIPHFPLLGTCRPRVQCIELILVKKYQVNFLIRPERGRERERAKPDNIRRRRNDETAASQENEMGIKKLRHRDYVWSLARLWREVNSDKAGMQKRRDSLIISFFTFHYTVSLSICAFASAMDTRVILFSRWLLLSLLARNNFINL